MISVIIPTYNRVSFLRESVESVLSQGYWTGDSPGHALELLIIDDGSTDETRTMIRELAGRLDYSFQEHSGVSAARNSSRAFRSVRISFKSASLVAGSDMAGSRLAILGVLRNWLAQDRF